MHPPWLSDIFFKKNLKLAISYFYHCRLLGNANADEQRNGSVGSDDGKDEGSPVLCAMRHWKSNQRPGDDHVHAADGMHVAEDAQYVGNRRPMGDNDENHGMHSKFFSLSQPSKRLQMLFWNTEPNMRTNEQVDGILNMKYGIAFLNTN